jgi:N-acylneuraminate cytidylyltransferase
LNNKYLALIPARGGSKGIKDKNIKSFCGKPLLHWTIEAARKCFPEDNICLSTASDKIISCAKEISLITDYKRPDQFATDTASSYDVILHALEFYKQQNRFFDAVVLLQPTSPLRNAHHIESALNLFKVKDDAVVSCTETAANPYSTLYETRAHGYIQKSKKGNFSRRQDQPKVYELNGAIYILNTISIKTYNSISKFPNIVKFEMDRLSSIDIDDMIDWKIAELFYELKNN